MGLPPLINAYKTFLTHMGFWMWVLHMWNGVYWEGRTPNAVLWYIWNTLIICCISMGSLQNRVVLQLHYFILENKRS